MRVTVERVRIGIVVLAILLVMTILLVFGVARFARRHLIHDLPERLGVRIQSSADGFTFSKSQKGRTLFTLHASKVVQYKGGGRATLHDVSIVLYGKQGNRADRIHGADFEYDPVSGIARAAGDVELDLQAPDSGGSGTAPAPDPGESTIHVKTSGLVFDKNTGIASTDKGVEFRFPEAAGKATGVRYDSEKGELVLNSAVEMSRSMNGEAFLLHASHAQILRDTRQAILLNVISEYRQDRSTADEVTLYFRPDGSADHVDARGNVHLATDDGRQLTAQRGSMLLDQTGQPLSARLAGGVLFDAEDAQHRMRGTAGEGTVEFGSKGILRHVQMRNSVTLIDQQLSLPDDPNGSGTRQMRSSRLDVDFVAAANRYSSPRTVLATGDAVVTLHTIRSQGPQQDATLQGDTLLANIGEGTILTSLEGKGHTRLTNVSADGLTQTSTGDSLLVKFDRDTTKHKATANKTAGKVPPSGIIPAHSAAIEIQSALQQGNVTLTQTPGKPDAKAAAQSSLTAKAERASYTGSDQVLRLEGTPHISNGNLDISAQIFEVVRGSGDALGRGGVKATYQQGSSAAPLVFGGQDPVHIVAERANLMRSSGDAVFRGHARLWQGANSIAAPVIELSRTQQTLKAHGEGAASQSMVNAAFLSPSGVVKQQQVVRVHSQQLIYSDAERKALFRGAVVAEDATGTIRSDETEIVLAPGQQAPAQEGEGVQGQVDHLIATGHVSLEQAGRRGTGEKLVYTTRSGLFVLGGTASAPPRLVDPERGTVTGDALIFNSRDDSVTVSGEKSGAVTETRVPK